MQHKTWLNTKYKIARWLDVNMYISFVVINQSHLLLLPKKCRDFCLARHMSLQHHRGEKRLWCSD